MNSSLLVPAFVVVALAAMGAVFFGDVFSSGAGTPHSDYAQAEMSSSSDVQETNATETMAREFTWDDEDDSASEQREPLDNAASESESFVSANNHTDDAPGEAFSTSEDKDAFGIGDENKDSQSSMDDLAGGSEDSFNSSQNAEVVSKHVDSDLDSFFNQPKESKVDADVVDRSSTSKPTKPEFVSQLDSSDLMEKSKRSTVDDLGTQMAAAAPKKEELSIDAFANESDNSRDEPIQSDLAIEASNSKAKSTDSSDVKLQSVVSGEPSAADTKSLTPQTQADADDVISGDLEAVVSSSNNQLGSNSSKTMVRKFKITNPKETTLPVTMSVDGEKITLNPDQTYVVNDHNGAVTVTFSRGGSFGFENKTLKSGHYRFSVSREAGWKLSN